MITNYEDKIEGMYDKNSEDFGAQRWGCGMQRAMMRRNDGVAARNVQRWGCGAQWWGHGMLVVWKDGVEKVTIVRWSQILLPKSWVRDLFFYAMNAKEEDQGSVEAI